MSMRTTPFLAACSVAWLSACVAPPPPTPSAAEPMPPALPLVRHITQGKARLLVESLYQCPVKVGNHRKAAVGEITAQDGTVLRLPAETASEKGLGPKAADLYNECAGITPANAAAVKADTVPVVEVDRDGEVITGYVVADNYFELYVNGQLVAVDNTPYTPFNSHIVRFKVKRPYTLAFKVVDWEEMPAMGIELMRGNPWYAGDGGLIARFSDGTVTDSSWKAQSFYIGPLNSPDEVVERGSLHDTTALGRVHPVAKLPKCQEQCFAVHYPMPKDWMSPTFDDRHWPRAYEYTDADIGVMGLPGYTRYPQLFEDARWLWTVNLVFDNVIVARKTVR